MKSQFLALFYLRMIRYIIILFSCFPILLAASKSHSHIGRDESLFADRKSDFITSPDNTFTCGFHSLGTDAYWFAIWFTNSRDKTVVWMANRDLPVNRRRSRVRIRRDGTMVLTDVHGNVVWQTNTTSSDVSEAVLLNTGNLILKNPVGHVLWQSFDFPTDTLLPSQTFTKNKRLTSVIRKGSYESGYFNLKFGDDNVLRLVSDNLDTSTSFWPNPDSSIFENGRTNYNSSRVAALDDMGRFHSSDQWQFNSSDAGNTVKRRLIMDYDGNLRVYSLIENTGLWDVTWQAIAQPCLIRGICGKNAICAYAPEPKCICPPGFEVEDPCDWNKGCKAKFNQMVVNARRVKFIEIPHTDYYGFDLNYTNPVTLETCRNMCLEDLSCQGFSYSLLGQGTCYLKSALFYGYASPDFPRSIYIKLPTTLEISTPNVFHESIKKKSLRWVYLFSFAGGLGAMELLFILLFWWFLLRGHSVAASVEAAYNMLSSQFRRYEYSELKKATNNFKQELGRGSSGAVYKGFLSSEKRVVAVKRLSRDFYQAEDEYSAEIGTLSKINHMNLVRIWGFCSGKRHRILVYEYLENLSLDRHIFGGKFLEWKQRYAVALGTAKGLAYLHHECLEWVIHCDIKPENILLDSEFQPKIADFGLAKLSQRGGTGPKFSRIRGTKGYMAPEWALDHPITAKVDVFGFGVVILEMVKGTRAYNWMGEGCDHNESALVSFVRKTKEKMENRSLDWVHDIVDPRLEGKFSIHQVITLIQTGIACVEEDRNKRPSMASVVQSLLDCEDDS